MNAAQDYAAHGQHELPPLAKASDYAALPAELRAQCEAFCLWKSDLSDPKKPRKKPLDWRGLHRGNDDPGLHLTFDQALLKLQARPQAGLAVYQPDEGMQIEVDGQLGYLHILDLDGFACDGVWEAEAHELCQLAGCTYIEESPSKTGLKMLLVSDAPPIKKADYKLPPSRFAEKHPEVKKYRNRTVEHFSRDFWNTLTGNHAQGKLQFIDAAKLATILRWLASKAPAGSLPPSKPSTEPKAPNTYAKPTPASLERVLSAIDCSDEGYWSATANVLARLYGEAGRDIFERFSRGDFEAQPYGEFDPHVVDARYSRALTELSGRPDGYGIKHLCQLAGIDPVTLDFEPPPLSPEMQWLAINPFAARMAKGTGQTVITMPDFGLTEAGNAQRIHRTFSANVAWVHELKQWLVFQNGKWQATTHEQVIALAARVMQGLLIDASNAADPTKVGTLLAHVRKSLSRNSLNAAVDLLKSQPSVEIHAAQLDANDMQLGTVTGQVIDLRTGLVRNQTPGDYITKSVACAHDSEAISPTWLIFLDSVFQGDADRIDYLQRWAGYALTGSTTSQQFLFMFGLGANGKTVLVNTLLQLWGSYGLQSQPEAFMAKGSTEGATPLLARLAGARLVIANETEDGQRLAESTVKQLTGSDTIVARPMYGQPFEFVPKFKLTMVGNHKPTIRGDDHGIWRRVHLLPFSRTFAPHEQDPDLAHKLRHELPGILNWALQGCRAWQREGRLSLPPIMRREVDSYRSEMDLIAQWLDDCCDIGANHTVTSSCAYQSFNTWCRTNGNLPFSNKRFSQKLDERGFTRSRTKKERIWTGFTCQGSLLSSFVNSW